MTKYYFILCLMLTTIEQVVAQKSLSTEQYKSWYSQHLDRFERKFEDQNVSCALRYLPPQLALLKQLPDLTSKSQFKSLERELKQSIDFMIKINISKDILPVSERNKFLLQLGGSIAMFVDDGDSIRCSEISYDQLGNISEDFTINVSFDKPASFENINIILSFQSLAPIIFSYTAKEINQLPALKWSRKKH